MLKMEGQFARCMPPYEVGEMLFLPNSSKPVLEVLSAGYGKAVGVAGFFGDQVMMAPWTVFRPLVGFPAGKYVYVVDERGYYSSHTDSNPPSGMTEYLPAGLEEVEPADP